jgi:hypothetical protein
MDSQLCAGQWRKCGMHTKRGKNYKTLASIGHKNALRAYSQVSCFRVCPNSRCSLGFCDGSAVIQRVVLWVGVIKGQDTASRSTISSPDVARCAYLQSCRSTCSEYRSFVQSIADTPMSQRGWSRDRAVGHFSTRACTVHNNSRIPQSRRLYSVDFHSRYLTLELCGVSWG